MNRQFEKPPRGGTTYDCAAPSGLLHHSLHVNPGLAPWAIIRRPFGAKTNGSVRAAERVDRLGRGVVERPVHFEVGDPQKLADVRSSSARTNSLPRVESRWWQRSRNVMNAEPKYDTLDRSTMIWLGGSSLSGASTSSAAGWSSVSGRSSTCGDGTITARSPWRLHLEELVGQVRVGGHEGEPWVTGCCDDSPPSYAYPGVESSG